MVATTTEKTISQIKKLQNSSYWQKNAPGELVLQQGSSFSWNPLTHTVTYDPSASDSLALTLHEIGHAFSRHAEYDRDITLLSIERQAWDMAIRLAATIDTVIDAESIERALDTYRDWLHARSQCPHCNATGIQATSSTYTCLACHQKWRVNEARVCQLRRYKLPKKPLS